MPGLSKSSKATLVKRILFVDDDAVYRMTSEYLFKHVHPEIEMYSISEASEVLPALQSF